MVDGLAVLHLDQPILVGIPPLDRGARRQAQRMGRILRPKKGQRPGDGGFNAILAPNRTDFMLRVRSRTVLEVQLPLTPFELTAPALGLLHKLTRLDDPGIRGRVLRDNLSPKTSLPLPDGSLSSISRASAENTSGDTLWCRGVAAGSPGRFRTAGSQEHAQQRSGHQGSRS